MINSILSPKVDLGPVAPSTPIHRWPLSYGFIYTQDDIGTWDFTSTDNFQFSAGNWTADRDANPGLSSLKFDAGTRKLSQASSRTLPTTHTLVFRHKGYTSTNTIFTVGSAFGSNIWIADTYFHYHPAYQQGGQIAVTNSTSTYYDWAIVRTGSTAKIYRNAVYLGELTGMTAAFLLSQITGWVGQMDFVTIYDYALSINEVDYIYQNP